MPDPVHAPWQTPPAAEVTREEVDSRESGYADCRACRTFGVHGTPAAAEAAARAHTADTGHPARAFLGYAAIIEYRRAGENANT